MTHDHASAREQLWELIKDIKFSMFITRHANGHLHARPMTVQNRKADQDDSLWFFMSRSGEPVAELLAQPEVNVSFSDPGGDRYVSVSGQAQPVEDAARKQALWNKMNEAWFPGGPGDSDLALVQVRISHAHFWNVRANKLTQLYHMAKAVVSDQRPRHLGDSEEVRMR